jgi:hypothetical protein
MVAIERRYTMDRTLACDRRGTQFQLRRYQLDDAEQ